MGFSVVGLALTAVGTYMQYEAGEDAKKASSRSAQAQKKSAEAQSRAAEVQAQRERLQQVRQARIAQAQIINTAGVAGMGTGTSGVAGGVASAGTQAASNIGAINVAQSFGAEASKWNTVASEQASKQAEAQTNAQMWGAVGGVGTSIFKETGGFGKLKTFVEGVTK